MEQYYSETIKIDGFSFSKIKKLYGILKGFKRNDTYFRIQTEDGKFKLSSCSFLILLSLCGLNESVELTLIGNRLEELRQTKHRIRRIYDEK